MNILWLKIRIAIIPSAIRRSAYIKKHHIFADVGDNFSFQPRIIPHDSKYIRFHNNCHVAANVTFINHDIINWCFSGIEPEKQFPRYTGCIEIMDNVFLGTGSIIMPNVRIGPNVIVAAGSVVTKDVPSGSIVGGVPARVIGHFDDLYTRRFIEAKTKYNKYSNPEEMWKDFYNNHQ